MNAKLKQKPQQILDFIKAYRDEHDYPPSLREIGRATGISSTSHISYYLEQLEEDGYIARSKGISRGIQLLEAAEAPGTSPARRGAETVAVPYLGYIVASAPLNVEPLPGDETVELSQALFGRDTSNLFALTVQGNSMIDALINDGDLVIFRQQERVENGQMAAVWLDDPGETTLKKLYYEGDQVRLQPANPTMEPFYEPATNVRVQGKVVMVIRQLG
ncbi:MAG: transcriptional repressor LexA [Chloroflexota bacterium]|nr:transcriptional repressor LexA [Chloroflexota bacterium]